MPKNIKNLLNQKTWSGEDVGKALFASLIHDVKNKGQDYEALFSQDDLERMEGSLASAKDVAVYGVFRELYNGVVAAFNKGQGLVQQFYHGYYRVYMTLDLAFRVDRALRDWESRPTAAKDVKNPLRLFTSLDDIAQDEAKRKELAFCAETLIRPALRYLTAYNALIGVMGNVYGVEGEEWLTVDLAPLKARLNALNITLRGFQEFSRGGPEERERKRALLNDLFQRVDIDGFNPSAEAVQRVAAEMREPAPALPAERKNFDAYLFALMGEGA